MGKLKIWVILGSFWLVTACSYNSPYRLLNWKTWEKNSTVGSASTAPSTSAFVVDENQTLPNQASCETIGLQNLESRNVVHCYNSVQSTAEDCAHIFEKKGYVRFRDIPHKTADYDFLKVDTYPTRRWRDSEITSRW